jgi:DNA-binding HxlR family transcriptional regulator
VIDMGMPKTAREQAQTKVEFNAFLAACPSRQLLDRISDKWVVLVLCALAGDTRPDAAAAGEVMRYSEIARLLGGVSQKMLTQTLRALERDGVITRTATPTVPVTVTYELTDLGRSLYAVTRGLRTWAQNNMGEVFAQREAYDARVS